MKQISVAELETVIIGMKDVGALISATEQFFCDGNIEEADRMCSILREIFEVRYAALCEIAGVR